MKQWMVFAIVVCMLGGCTTWQPLESKPTDLPQHFNDGGLLKAGDHVLIRTTHGKKIHLLVRSVQDEVIRGDKDSVAFTDIATLEKRVPSAAKTTILVVAILGVAGAVAYAASHSAPKFNLDGGH